MKEFSIPNPGQVPAEASDLTKQEIADLTPAKRNIILYEREIEYLKDIVAYLQGIINSLQTENAILLAEERSLLEDKTQLEVVRRSKLEMYFSFAIGTFVMALGGGLLGSFPTTPINTPWQHVVGWACIILGAIFGLFSRTILQLTLHFLPRAADALMR